MKKTKDECERTIVYELSYAEVQQLIRAMFVTTGAIASNETLSLEPITSWVHDNQSFDLLGFRATVKRREMVR